MARGKALTPDEQVSILALGEAKTDPETISLIVNRSISAVRGVLKVGKVR